ncbi:MAG: efflux RND transporter periplasmic adaptor subunit [Bacteroidia bacterium]|nr:efflux RND transporter periplasmic adaptor subunit [Bacteroidia bacterium]MBP9690250.1 efflux RND transporter periplasmic adaptor subunit [Bacteroidia bacterium]
MKTIKSILMVAGLVTIFAACGGGNDLESKKAELEKLKAQQVELAAKIADLNDEVIALGDTSTHENLRAKVIATTTVATQNFIHAIDVQGRVDGDENIVYSAKAPGMVKRVNVKVGDKVSAGQVLAELDADVIKSQIETVKKGLELAAVVYEKRKALWDQKVGSELEFLQAKNQKENLEKQIASIKENLQMYVIKAEYSGTVDLVNIKVGQGAAPGVPAISVINPSALKIKADLSESYANLVKQGNPVLINFPDINKSSKSVVTYASKSINNLTRTFNVEVALPSESEYHPNMVAEIKIVDYENKNAMVVPINVIQEIDGQKLVYIVTKDSTNKTIAKKVVVKVGKTYGTNAEILNGLNVGDQVITTGYQDLTDGEEVKF